MRPRPVTDAQIETAERAVRMMDKMIPALEGYVEALTGKRMRVKLSGGGTRTDNTTIFVTPPYALGKEEVHDRRLCDLRDEHDVPMCEACDNREKILALVYHEISHVAFGTFTKVTSGVQRKLAEMDSVHAADIARMVGKHLSTTYGRDQAGQVAAIIEREFLPTMANAYEDIRVDCRMREARPGTYYIQKVLRERMFHEGSLDPRTGERVFWKDKPLNGQAIVASLVAAEGEELEGVFHPYVVQVFNTDEKLRAIVERASSAASVEDSFVNAVEAMIRLQQHGFFEGSMVFDEPTPEPEPEEEESKDDGGESSDDPSEGLREPDSGGEDSGADEPGDEPSDSDEPDASDDGGSGSDASDEDGDEADGDEDAGASESSDSGDDGGADASEPGDDGAASGDDGEPAGAEGEGDEADSAGDGGAAGMADTSGSGEPGSGESSGEGTSAATGDSATSDDLGDVSGADDEALGEAGEAERDEDEGAERVERPEADRFGDSDSAKEALEELLGHDDEHEPTAHRTDKETPSEEQAVESVTGTYEYFERPSKAISGVKEVKSPAEFPRTRGVDLKEYAPETILGPALLVLRKALEENKRSKMDRNRRSGRVSPRVLGRRAWSDDDRLFQRKTMPGKRDYAVLIGIDVSGSTAHNIGGGTVCDLAVRAAYAQAELCSRLGIKFAVYAHSGTAGVMEIFEVKSFEEPWSTKQKDKMGRIKSRHQNLDGHTVEYYRKKIERIPTTDRIIMYYSDGAMPAENYEEELMILKREIAYCKKAGIVLMAVGVRTDAPEKHKLDTARLDSMKDISKVVKHLGDRIMAA